MAEIGVATLMEIVFYGCLFFKFDALMLGFVCNYFIVSFDS